MVFERGPRGKLHVLSYRKGCYHGRVTDCCYLCLGRVAVSAMTAPLRDRFRSDQCDEYELLGTQVVVPYLDRSVSSSEVDYRKGTVSDVYAFAGDDPDLLTVEIDDDTYVHIDVSADERRETTQLQHK